MRVLAEFIDRLRGWVGGALSPEPQPIPIPVRPSRDPRRR
ncbi:hypothetical protein SAMN05444417_3039 [Wenxinia saemankumensis]|uniref:Uncharacterized protein n=1 Tax=Wenxinia saemankumensis TaxID=1447782 RepID=A0A1M6H0K8_9RHOB|nr:hypothetical protein SAMN05444417_3039 [Wenxinia saemankumensis]